MSEQKDIPMAYKTNEGLNLAAGRSADGEEAVLREAIQILERRCAAANRKWGESDSSEAKFAWGQLALAYGKAAGQLGAVTLSEVASVPHL